LALRQGTIFETEQPFKIDMHLTKSYE
jgi:hypothetical protein